ncbi:MAG: Na+/H+ antiporter subunit E [Blautia sp.]|nr:Na+/H+ antiporter subunit E [Blautia sp.]
MFILIFLLWIILNGSFSIQTVLIGLLISGALCWFARKVLGFGEGSDHLLVRYLPWAVRYVGNLLMEIIKAALNVASLVFSLTEHPDPVIVEFHSGFAEQFKNVLLANSITLTPGTYTMFQEGDFFVVHCLRREYADGLEESSFVRLLDELSAPGSQWKKPDLSSIKNRAAELGSAVKRKSGR